MTEEEKKAIETFKSWKDYNIRNKNKLLKADEIMKVQETILNLIEKLQKENEELKQDRNNNYQMIALAQNEALGYMQGYEDGKKLKKSAMACVVENQQYYIIKKAIEHYKEYIEKLQKENEELKIAGIPVRNKRNGKIGIVLRQWKSGSIAVLESINPRVINTHDSWNTLEIVTDEVKQTQTKCETIPVSFVKGKIEELNIAILECEYLDDDDEEYKKAVEKDKFILKKQRDILEELIEEREEK